MIVVDLLLNMFFYCFAFSFMRLFFWLIEPKISKKQKEVTKNKVSKFFGIHYFCIYKEKKLYIVMYFFFLILFVFSFILSICECFILSDFITKISKISGKILWYYFCIVGIVYWFVLKIKKK